MTIKDVAYGILGVLLVSYIILAIWIIFDSIRSAYVLHRELKDYYRNNYPYMPVTKYDVGEFTEVKDTSYDINPQEEKDVNKTDDNLLNEIE